MPDLLYDQSINHVFCGWSVSYLPWLTEGKRRPCQTCYMVNQVLCGWSVSLSPMAAGM